MSACICKEKKLCAIVFFMTFDMLNGGRHASKVHML